MKKCFKILSIVLLAVALYYLAVVLSKTSSTFQLGIGMLGVIVAFINYIYRSNE